MKVKLLLPIFLFITGNCLAQIYVTPSIGYGFPMMKQLIAVEMRSANGTGHYPVQFGFGSYGQGIDYGFSAGYTVHSKFSFECGYSYHNGIDFNSKLVDTTNGNDEIINDRTRATFSRISAGMNIRISKAKWCFNSGSFILMSMNFRKYYHSEFIYMDTVYNRTYDWSMNYSGGTPLGFEQRLGINYRLNPHFVLGLNADLIFESWAPHQSVTTQSALNGVDQISLLSYHDSHAVYTDNYDQNPFSTSADGPMILQKFMMPLSSYGLQFSATYLFAKKVSAKTDQ